MEYELSVFAFLNDQIEDALKEIETQNYGKAKEILYNALESAPDYDFTITNKRNRF